MALQAKNHIHKLQILEIQHPLDQYLDDVECLGNLGNHANVSRGNDKPSIF